MDFSRPRCSPWRELVLVASLLACGIFQTSGQVSIVPFIGLEGYRSFLDLENIPEDAQEYSWHRGVNDSEGSMIVSYKPPSNSWQSGPMFSGRENVTTEGRLRIKNSMLNDTGNYTVRVDVSSGTHRATSWLEIREKESNPGISTNTTSVVEYMDSVAAFCHTNATTVTWYVNGIQVSSNDLMTISPDGKTLVILKVNRYDVILQCALENILGYLQKSAQIFLTVAYGPDSVWLRSDPSNFNGVLSAELGSKVEMKCTSTAFPEPKHRWIHNGSLLSVSEANITLPSLTWEQMGRYRCIVENPVAQLTMYRDVRIQRNPEYIPIDKRDFYISGSLVVVLIVMTVLGGIYFCGILVYVIISHFSRTNRAI
ncbi:carcinoembryonic antigen-related cell adhesion molecule 18 isoform X2 [Rhinolophus ferrumequinum]|uniref:CEA cell adhesion molecule 18 n=1 Tax=Rhinolophus ferrumequinum TaxID=59479 RepID=A0A671EI25_RHIFE|nr:carcinoembryonic antigen-related cell adhesion molecule 18 isoform X2 [Rhinolophus ferrumequinum]XP_032983182.1 carcinoembryonic antigen-related cell adhesion molecule 18 isoform X2 [Rhinolophus ferrumequinum]XP_032983183.1 carcinoembryonic antigen-related cell adhesion molecule 18 isoform X2 [Rhinolophus ferrumequinum]